MKATIEPMEIDDIIEFIEDMDAVLTLRPQPGDGSPEIAWGDVFFYYSPTGRVPARTQPFATIITKNYPGDDRSGLDRAGAFRLNIDAGPEMSRRWTGREPREATDEDDPSRIDTVIAHPVYGTSGWLAVVNPGADTRTAVGELLRHAHERARARYDRRAG